jgi:putative proteasome-type protease
MLGQYVDGEMTFCLGIRVEEGLLGLADTRITTGTENTMARKIAIYERDGFSMFLMTSGLRSIRDKTLTYFEREHNTARCRSRTCSRQ